jgi:hypothetical protein
VLGLIAACASKPVSIRAAGTDAASSPGDGSAILPVGRDARISPADASPSSRGDGPTMSANGDLPFGWKSSVPIGAPGWRNTPTPLCDAQQGWGLGGTSGLWADSRGVFVLGWKYCGYVDRILAGCPNDGTSGGSGILELNDGSGWRTLFEGSLGNDGTLTGIPNGPLVLTGTDCRLSQLDPDTGAETCWLEDMWTYSRSTPIFVVNPAVAYAAADDRLFDFRAGAWTLEIKKTPETLHAVWGTEEVAYLAGDYQPYLWSRTNPSTLVALPNAPSASHNAVWGFAENDVWFGNSFGQLVHYDGTSFTVRQASAPERQGIVGLWGQGGQLYFSTSTEFGRVVDGSPETLLSLSGSPPDYGGVFLGGMWGLSPTDVFVVLAGACPDHLTPCRCNSVFWFDGQNFHQL